jgi:2-dehydropantoate 2-reductase
MKIIIFGGKYMNIAVIGLGGVGGFFGGKLARLTETDSSLHLSFIARGDHLREIQKSGLLLDSDEGEMICKPGIATDKISEIPVPDLCLICVKSFHMDSMLNELNDKITDKTILLPLLNGVDIYERIRNVTQKGIILPSCVYIGSHIEKPGKVTQRGGTRTIHFGKDPQNDYMDSRIFDLFDKAGIKYNWMDDPYTEIWSKFVFIASYGLVTAAFDKTIGEVVASGELSGHVKSVMNEVAEIAHAKKIMLPATIVEDAFMKGGKFPFETKTSFQRDYAEMNKPDERDLFGGTIIRMGQQFGILTPATEFVLNILQKNKVIKI